MNETLMKHVERVVRPVRSGKVRKLAMRRELLAHLTSIYEEEATKTADEAAALAAASSRFGEPAELTRELDRAVPWHGRVTYVMERGEEALARWFGWKLAEPWWQYARRAAVALIVLHASVGVLLLALVMLAPGSAHDRTSIPVAAKFLFYSIFGEWLFLVALRGVYSLAFRSQSPWRWMEIAGILAGSCLFAVAVGGVFLWHLVGDFAEVTSRLPRMAMVSVIEIPVVVFLAVLAARYVERRDAPHREWSRLELEE